MYTQWRNATTGAAMHVGGAPPALETALASAKATLDQINQALHEPSSESAVRLLAKLPVPTVGLPSALGTIGEMVTRLQDGQLPLLYAQIGSAESKILAREAIAEFVQGEKSHSDLVVRLKQLQTTGTGPGQPRVRKVQLTTQFAELRDALKSGGLGPDGGWEAWDHVSGPAQVTIEVSEDAESGPD